MPFPSPGDLPDPGIEPGSSAQQEDFLLSEPPGKPGELSVITRFFIRETGGLERENEGNARTEERSESQREM